MPYITTESRCHQPPERFFSLLPAKQAAIFRICHPRIREMLSDAFFMADRALVDFTARYIETAHRTLEGGERQIALNGEIATSFGVFRANDLPSIRAALSILAPILAEVRGEVSSEQKAA